MARRVIAMIRIGRGGGGGRRADRCHSRKQVRSEDPHKRGTCYRPLLCAVDSFVIITTR
jgi:hypothetical protein